MQWFKYTLIAASLGFAGLAEANDPQVYTLKNGLKLVVKTDTRAPVVVSQVWYKAGSADELSGTTGMAHMLEHMMFKGTTAYPKDQFDKIIEANGGDQNAFTADDFTAYYQNLANDRLEVSFKLESDRMRNLIITQDDLTKELEVVKEERRMRIDDQPDAVAFERLRAAAFISHPYHHLTIGWMNDLNNFTLEDVKYWYNTWYSPNNATIVVVGDVEPESVHQLAERYFGQLKPSVLPLRKNQIEPPPLGTRQVTVRIPAQVSTVMLAYNVPSRLTDSSWKPYALAVLSGILDQGASSRLPQELVQKQQIASGVAVNYDPYTRYSTIFNISAHPAQGKSLSALQTSLMQEIKKLQTTKVSADELARVKTQIIAAKVYSKDSQSGQAMEIGELETIGLGWQEADKFIETLQSITPDQVQQVAVEFLQPERLTIAVLEAQPIKNQKPTEPTGERPHA